MTVETQSPQPSNSIESTNPSFNELINILQDNLLTSLCLLLIGIFFVVYMILRSKSRKTTSGKSLFIVGECGSGKTTLLYALVGSQIPGTISSIEPNDVKLTISNLQNPKRITEINAIDIPGHSHSKTKFLSCIKEAKGIIMMIDSSEKSLMPNSADFLYRILITPEYQKKKIPILICLNKQDLANSRKINIVEEDIINEIERLKISRRAIEDENSKNDYLKLEYTRFSFGKYPIKFCESSIKNNDIQQIQKFINGIYF